MSQNIDAAVGVAAGFGGRLLEKTAAAIQVARTGKALTAIVADAKAAVTATGLTIAFIQTEEGRARKSGTVYKYEYDLRDHLGDTRLTTTWDPADATQMTPLNSQHTDYYAFGYTIQSSQNVIANPKNEYLYNGKELQEETGLYDYGARLYDPVVGRWTSVDPLVEKGRRWSPYVYGFDDPIGFEDPDGMWPGQGFLSDLWSSAKSGFTGYYTSAAAGAKAVYNKVTNPSTITLKDIGHAFIEAQPLTHTIRRIKTEVSAVNALVHGDGKTLGHIIGNETANTATVLATDGVLSGAAKGISAIRGTAASGLGDLTSGEVRSIQKVVDQAERPLEVGGAAATGTRRGVGTDLPVGKGPGTRSDIDYLAPPSAQPYFDGLQGGLPGLDPKSGIIPGTGNPYIGPFIRFEPGAKPTVTPKAN